MEEAMPFSTLSGWGSWAGKGVMKKAPD